MMWVASSWGSSPTASPRAASMTPSGSAATGCTRSERKLNDRVGTSVNAALAPPLETLTCVAVAGSRALVAVTLRDHAQRVWKSHDRCIRLPLVRHNSCSSVSARIWLRHLGA
eukprot:145251-Alexandrium_andersonii.AAC.1